jgi:hypothetical protein
MAPERSNFGRFEAPGERFRRRRLMERVWGCLPISRSTCPSVRRRMDCSWRYPVCWPDSRSDAGCEGQPRPCRSVRLSPPLALCGGSLGHPLDRIRRLLQFVPCYSLQAGPAPRSAFMVCGIEKPFRPERTCRSGDGTVRTAAVSDSSGGSGCEARRHALVSAGQ